MFKLELNFYRLIEFDLSLEIPMRHFVFIAALILLFSPFVWAETMYVSDLAEITLRTGKGVDHKIIAMIKSGVQVEVIEPDDQWTKIKLPSGREGWVVSRFLTTNKPCSLELEELQSKHAALLAFQDTPFNELSKLQEENRQLHSELAVGEKALNEVKSAYETLKKESAELAKLNSTDQQIKEKLEKQKQKTAQLENELSKLIRQRSILWFVSGAAVLLVGFFLGLSTKRQRKRSSLLS